MPAEERHRDVRVPVDEAGDDGAAARVDDLARDVNRPQNLCPLPHGDDAPARDRHRAVLDDAAAGVHRHDRPAAHDEVNALRPLRGGRRRRDRGEL